MGIGYHIDHTIVAAIGRHMLKEIPSADFGFYEDMPYAGNNPGIGIKKELQKTLKLTRIKLQSAPIARKLKLLSIYKTQLGAGETQAVINYHARNPSEPVWVPKKSLNLFVTEALKWTKIRMAGLPELKDKWDYPALFIK